ncbi:rho GTPase-activating protein 19-like isoform X2 [Anneissia japonica]|uniref:rho GTPase-activating protein 19-like isoform X2 n=1 Tax=Anneissia japonica TaxID=1529436 RepID=UPI001425694F|nr:rho GTPase-activating protein 19-like isoform X2 [Anneissia japonica]
MMARQLLCNPLHYVEVMKHKYPEKLTEWCCTELSNLLDFNGPVGLGQILAGKVDVRQGKTIVKKFQKNKKKGTSSTGVFGAPLTEEGYCHARLLIEFLKQYVTKEGIFRVPGNSERQRLLKEKINSGVVIDLDSDRFTPHDVACVLKTFLGDLPEPLLTDRHYTAHVQAAELTYKMHEQFKSSDPAMRKKLYEKRRTEHIMAVTNLMLMLPVNNYKLMKDLLDLLHQITEEHELSKMTAFNLGVMFAPHILWPRYFTTDDVRDQNFVNMLNCAVEFMITNCKQIFKVPAHIKIRCEKFVKSGGKESAIEDCSEDKVWEETKASDEADSGLVISGPQPATVQVKNELNNTGDALSQLYSDVQSMPPSAKKRKLMKQFMKNSHMPGTPTRIRTDADSYARERQRKHGRSRSLGEIIVKNMENRFISKKKRQAPAPPENDAEVRKHFHAERQVMHELKSQLFNLTPESSTPTRTIKITRTIYQDMSDAKQRTRTSSSPLSSQHQSEANKNTSKDSPRTRRSRAIQARKEARNRPQPVTRMKSDHTSSSRPVPAPRTSVNSPMKRQHDEGRAISKGGESGRLYMTRQMSTNSRRVAEV